MTDKPLTPLLKRGVLIFLSIFLLFSCTQKTQKTEKVKEVKRNVSAVTDKKEKSVLQETSVTPSQEKKKKLSPTSTGRKEKGKKEEVEATSKEKEIPPKTTSFKKESREEVKKEKEEEKTEEKEKKPEPPEIRFFRILHTSIYGEVFFEIASTGKGSIRCVLVLDSLRSKEVPCKGIVREEIKEVGDHRAELIVINREGIFTKRSLDFSVGKRCEGTRYLFIKDFNCSRGSGTVCALKLFTPKSRLIEIKGIKVLSKGLNKSRGIKVCVGNRCRRRLPVSFRVRENTEIDLRVILPKAVESLGLNLQLEVNMKEEPIHCDWISSTASS